MKAAYKKMLRKMQEREAAAGVAAEPSEPWYLYILECGDGSYYTGVTKDLERRVGQHNAGTASRYTRTHLPVKLVYSERCESRTAALVRECVVKALPRGKKEQLVGSNKCSSRKDAKHAKPAR